ncbi:SDR family oxidoreductase [Streptacidiphilus monticola]
MRIVIAGGHGKIALRLERLLSARGDEVYGLVRAPGQADDLRASGAEPIVCDLESASVQQLADVLSGTDVAVFAAGAGGGSQAHRTVHVDRDGAVKFVDAAVLARVPRFLMVSSMGAATRPEGMGDQFARYLQAKGEADAHLTAQPGLEWTVLRPGVLGDEPGSGRVRLAEHTGRGGVPRDDVAAVLAELTSAPSTAGKILELIAGETPVAEAVRAVS